MSSPAKRRKRNDQDSPAKAGRGIDYFFSRSSNQEDAALKLQKVDAREKSANPQMTDEELARKLQQEWNQEEDNHAKAAEQKPSTLELEESVSNSAKSKETKDIQPNLKTLALQSTANDEDLIASNIPFDENPLSFEPSKYLPDLQRHWAAEGGHATYAILTRCFVLVNGTTSRIKIVDTLVNTLRVLIEGDCESLLPAVWLATNSIAPPYVDLDLGIGGSAISKALKKVCGLDSAGLKTIYNKHGDAGDVAYEAKRRQSFMLRKPKPLTISAVYDTLLKIANSNGQGSQEFKQGLVERLIQGARGPEESRYIVRTLVQHLRIGAVRTTMLIALSRAFLLSTPPGASYEALSISDLKAMKKEQLTTVYQHAEEQVKTSFARHPNYGDLIPALLEVGVGKELILRCGLTLHIPLRPMLGNITRDLTEMLVRLQGREFSCEYKYDGQRAQVHCDENGRVTIFSRHLETMTDKYPDLVDVVPAIRGDGVASFILEGEVVAVDKSSGELKPFQTLSNRAKKDVDIAAITVNVCLFAFDLMFLNGEPLLERTFRERRSLLRSLFIEVPHQFTWVKNMDANSNDHDKISEFFKSATDAKCEGIMVKVLDNSVQGTIDPATPRSQDTDTKTKPAESKSKAENPKPSRRKAVLSTYEPDKRLESWLKVKKDYHAAADTIDLVPVGAWHGHGRKSAWWSPILLAARDPHSARLVAVTKCMSGFTDAFYRANRARYDPDEGANVGARPAYVEYAGGEPDVWFEPQEVWEIAFADVTLSPTYTAAVGLVSDERGLSLRFPRFLRVREDKGVEDASTEEFLADLWWKQSEPRQAGDEEAVASADE